MIGKTWKFNLTKEIRSFCTCNHALSNCYVCDNHLPKSSLFHMKTTASVTKSSHRDRGPLYLRLPIFFSYTYTVLFCWKIKS